MQIATVGFRAKTARAVAIALTRDNFQPTYLARWDVALYDPAVPATRQPYHEVMDLPWGNARVREFEEYIEKTATDALGRLVGKLHADGFLVTGVGIVGSP